MRSQILIDHRWALGDTVLVTALVRDIVLAYPKQFDILVHTNWSRVWDHNPHIVTDDAAAKSRARRVSLNYQPGIDASNAGQKIHCLAWCHKDFERQTGMKVPVRFPHGDLHLSEQERQPLVAGKYWVVNAGTKLDMTAKHWPYYQEVVDLLRRQGFQFVQVGATHTDHIHPPLDGAFNMIGQTENIRDLFSLIYHSQGVICGITACMHIAACFNKPCVVLAGGREDPWWEWTTNRYKAYGPECAPVDIEHAFLHTMGELECCKRKACWADRTVPLNDADRRGVSKKRLCADPVKTTATPTPRCMTLITPEKVVEAALAFNGKSKSDSTLFLPGLGNITLPPLSLSPVTSAPLELARPPDVIGKQQQDYQRRVPGTPPPVMPKIRPAKTRLPQVYEHPAVGGKFTICVLCYGDYFDLARRCLSSILTTVPMDRIDLRVALNEVCEDTRRFVEHLPRPPLTKIYVNKKNILKAPAMRQLFHDPEHPIVTPYTIWFDDDSYAMTGTNWLENLAGTIAINDANNAKLYGIRFLHDLQLYRHVQPPSIEWFRSATWWRGRDLYLKGHKRTAPNGSVIHFVAGGCLALATDVIHMTGVPDKRLGHNGIDITIGAMNHAAGFDICDWNRGKQLVFSSGHTRRGHSELFPWARSMVTV